MSRDGFDLEELEDKINNIGGTFRGLKSRVFGARTQAEPQTVQDVNEMRNLYGRWRERRLRDLNEYPYVRHESAPFTPARRALPMTNFALISSAGAYIDGTAPFDTENYDGDFSFREIPIEVEAEDLQYAARGYDPTAVRADRNAQIPIERLLEYQANGVIGQLNPVWWSFNGCIPNGSRFVEETIPQMVERVRRHDVQAALLIPASELCHQSIGLLARALESAKIPTMTISVNRAVSEAVKPPRAAYYKGELGSVAGLPNHSAYQRRILDESLRWIESLDQPTVKKLVVELETSVEESRGER